ncbi:MAG: hypothetical protein IRZ06_12230 [Nevskia sp.]|nr:hypothetical protein [Nevskia sp.]
MITKVVITGSEDIAMKIERLNYVGDRAALADVTWVSDWEATPSGDWVSLAAYTLHGSYAGSVAGRANYHWIIDHYGDDAVVTVVDRVGTRWLAARWPMAEELAAIIRGLDRYPVIDDDVLLKIEYEDLQRAWPEYGRAELRHRLGDTAFTDDDLDRAFATAFAAGEIVGVEEHGEYVLTDADLEAVKRYL